MGQAKVQGEGGGDLMSENFDQASPQKRGVVIFHFGYEYGLRLLVCLYTLRKYYSGPVTVFLRDDKASKELRPLIEKMDISVEMKRGMSQSFDRHRVFLESPYESTLSIDSDTIFQGPIDELWEPLEREGCLVTRCRIPSYGVEGTPQRPGWGNRVGHLQSVKTLLTQTDFDGAMDRLLRGTDINIGMLGFSRPKGNAFLQDWTEHMERGQKLRAVIMDEILIVSLYWKYPHALVEDKWNCPASEYFRQSNVGDARMIHYFSDGTWIFGARIGRSTSSWAGRKWFEAYREAELHMDLKRWRRRDPYFYGPITRLVKFIANQPNALMYTLRRLSKALQARRIARVTSS
jgi:hypothetical protein